ncbi:MAG: phage recombination protein Bet [Elusimicrobiota bacterium]|nr:phage recombination protein Bet [Endomicrobiia bacterium]MDW8165163.1 phage recombination protein Bet [Elusimicrobiota bacterium]
MSEIRKYEKSSLSKEIVKKYIMPDATDEELFLFLQKCRLYNLNPFKGEIYAVPYRTENGVKYNIVISYQVFLKRAFSNPNFAGFQSGIIVLNQKGEIETREGTFMLSEEKLLGGWCKVYRRDWTQPYYVAVNIEDYQKDTKIWKSLRAFMIMKVAIATAFRMTFPEELQGLYIEEEIQEGNQERNKIIKEIVSFVKNNNLIEKAKEFIKSTGKNELKELTYNEMLKLYEYLKKEAKS